MRIKSPLGRLLAAGLALVGASTSLAACSLADAANTAPQPKRGGTLFVNMGSGIDKLDPQRTYNASDMNVLRLTTRTLTTYTATPGSSTGDILPDLATDTGRPSDNNTVWSFTIKPGVKWEGGEPVICSQIKYGIERNFSSILEAPVPYPMDYLAQNAKPYEGPYVGDNNGGKGLESVQCLDEHNIVFHLSKPRGDFNYTVAMATFAPVLPEKDTHLDYAKHPYANGPYKLQGDLTDKGVTLVRNGFWTEQNDQVRKAYPDKIVIDFRPDENGVVTNQVIDDQGDARSTVMLDANVKENFLQQVVNDSDLVKRIVTGPSGAVRWLGINTQVVTNPACRQALIYAFDKRKYRSAAGGSIIGAYATTMIPPGLRGHRNFDLFDTLSNPEGQPEKAAALIKAQAAAKTPCPTVYQVAFPEKYKRQMTTMVDAYALAGIQIQLVTLPPRGYYSTGIGDWTNNHYAMVLAGWIPDWANGSAVLPPLFAGSSISPINPATGHTSGNTNYEMLNDNTINTALQTAETEANPDRQSQLWGDLDQQIQSKAVTVPLLYENAIRLTGSNVLGGFISPAFGEPDLCALGLAQP
jgi:peptide/nickel transport system substrate-binding protein